LDPREIGIPKYLKELQEIEYKNSKIATMLELLLLSSSRNKFGFFSYLFPP
jgi:hypothetical protein